MEKVRYQDMLPHEIVARRRRFPAAFVPIGVLEWHGEHLAVGMDGLLAERLCEIAAAQSGGFSFPTVWYGGPLTVGFQEANRDPEGRIRRKMRFRKGTFNEQYLGLSVKEQIEFYDPQMYHLLLQLHQLEMKAVCLVFGHVPWRDLASKAIARFTKRYKDTAVFSEAAFYYPLRRHRIGDHAAKWETSCLWHVRPDCVDLSVYRGREKEPLINVLGEDPRSTATVEQGRKACNLMVEAMVRKAEYLLGKKRSGSEP